MLLLIRIGFDITSTSIKSIIELETVNLELPILFWSASDTNILIISPTCKWEKSRILVSRVRIGTVHIRKKINCP